MADGQHARERAHVWLLDQAEAVRVGSAEIPLERRVRDCRWHDATAGNTRDAGASPSQQPFPPEILRR